MNDLAIMIDEDNAGLEQVESPFERCDFHQTAHIKDTVHELLQPPPKISRSGQAGPAPKRCATSALMPISINFMASGHILLVGEGPGNQPDVLPLRAQEAAVRPESTCLSGAFFVWRNRKQGMLQDRKSVV